jgi:hypothetical protein
MKKVTLLVVLVVGVWFGVNYLKTGQWSLSPQNQEERTLRDLEKELAGVNAQISQAGRTAGMTGIDTSADVAALMKKKEDLEKRISAARQKQR